MLHIVTPCPAARRARSRGQKLWTLIQRLKLAGYETSPAQVILNHETGSLLANPILGRTPRTRRAIVRTPAVLLNLLDDA